MREELLHFIWSEALYNQKDLKTTDGQTIEVYNQGNLNTISGPDFSDARIKIGDELWVGNVEIHVNASEWNQHKHQNDPAYNNVILHVVFSHDVAVLNEAGATIPSLELFGRISRKTLSRYDTLKTSQGRIPCSDHFPNFPKIQFIAWLDRLLINRLERKTQTIGLNFEMAQADWLQTFYTTLAGCFGQNTNKLAYEELARILPFSLVNKYSHDTHQLEALLYGAAGLLPDKHQEEYPKRLYNEWKFLSKKHNLRTISTKWKFGGIRPDAFPTRRLFLLARLIPLVQTMYQSVVKTEVVEFPTLDTKHPFWRDHYTFDKAADKPIANSFSKGFKNLVMINGVAPFTFFYGRSTGAQKHIDHAVKMLESSKVEVNKFTKQWKKIGFTCESAADSQAIIELTTQYCMHKNCVLCPVGKSIITES